MNNKYPLNLGLDCYKSRLGGIGGKLKSTPADFIVCEIDEWKKVVSLEGDIQGDTVPGDFTHFTLVKENWDTMKAIKEISKRLGCSQNKFQYAGTKDKYALTAQRVSAYKVGINQLKNVRIKDMILKDFGYDDEGLGLGSLWGNHFKIVVRDVCEDAKDLVGGISSELESGFPNFYGMQRFGDKRPITHLVGKKILQNDLEGAVNTYLFGLGVDMAEDELFARTELEKTGDYREAAKNYPKRLGYEMALINHLIQYEGDFRGALNSLPQGLTKMFIHAFQSYVFNKALSICLREGHTVERLPLVGYDTEPDSISKKILEEEEIAVEDFAGEWGKNLRSKGTYRDCFQIAYDFEYSVDGDSVTFEFSLKSGVYATVLLREYMKN